MLLKYKKHHNLTVWDGDILFKDDIKVSYPKVKECSMGFYKNYKFLYGN